MMKVGYYKEEMIEIEAVTVTEAAVAYADEKHQIDEESDMRFELYVEDNKGKMFSVKMYTEYYPRYGVESSTVDI
tara:strand:- start:686 stop:910 length:225 start_codon:yes stop_codon:yes gene_type:complete